MKIKIFNGLNVLIDKKLELMLAIQVLYLKNHPEIEDKLDFIEIPPITYLNELDSFFNLEVYQKLIDDILKFKDESVFVAISLSLNDKYELDNDRTNYDKIYKYIGNVDLDDFVLNF